MFKIDMRFSDNVYELCRRIPRGKVSTYGMIAGKMKTKACRAVGNALNKNPYKSVPCHRVINSNGFVGQFSKGTEAKIRMLKSEGIIIDKNGFIDLTKYLYKFK